MKDNEGKCHVLLSTDETIQVKISGALINSGALVNVRNY